MKALICLNGNPPSKDFLTKHIRNAFIIAADGACSYLINYGIKADVIVGDFDSIKMHEAQKALKINGDIVEHCPVKDYTDGQLALQEAVKRGYDDIAVAGAIGGRLDHEYENVRLLNGGGNSVKIIDENCEVFLLRDEYNATLPLNTTVSILPYSDSVIIKRAEGFRYKAELLKINKLDAFGHSGLSNMTVEENVRIIIEDGTALVVINFN